MGYTTESLWKFLHSRLVSIWFTVVVGWKMFASACFLVKTKICERNLEWFQISAGYVCREPSTNMFYMDVSWNTHFSCKDLESSNWIPTISKVYDWRETQVIRVCFNCASFNWDPFSMGFITILHHHLEKYVLLVRSIVAKQIQVHVWCIYLHLIFGCFSIGKCW